MWFVTFLICLAIPPLLIAWFAAVFIVAIRPIFQKRYAKAEQIRTADIPPRGYRSGQALINNRVRATPASMSKRRKA